MKKNLSLLAVIILTIILLMTTVVSATNEDVTLSKVSDTVCNIDLGEDGKLTKKLISVDNDKKEIILQVDVTNIKSEEEIIEPSEIILLIDNSKSMTSNTLSDGTTRKQAVFSAASELVDKILTEQSSTKIGVVRFSTSTDISKEGTLEDASLVIAPTSNATDIKTAINNIETNGVRTDIDAGLQVAKENFSSTETNKYLILLTDGVPNTAVGGPTMTYGGEVTTKTKATLDSLKNSGINIVTVMTGVNATYVPDPTNSPNKTYKDLAEDIFGTQEAPNYGKFYYVTDENVTNTITQNVYSDVRKVITNEIKDIVVKDYFPDNIIENYNFSIYEKENVGEVTATVNTEDNSITWNISTLEAGKTASFKYKLTLKDEFNENILNVVTPTNKKVEVTYTDTTGNKKDVSSTDSPSVKLTKEEKPIINNVVENEVVNNIVKNNIINNVIENEVVNNTVENKIINNSVTNNVVVNKVVINNKVSNVDNTVANKVIPQTGDTNAYILTAIILLAVGITIYYVKNKKNN